MPFVDEMACAGTGNAGEGLGEEAVQPLSRAFRRNLDRADFRQDALRVVRPPGGGYQTLEGIRPVGFTRRSTSARLKKFVLCTTSGSTRLR